MFDIKGIRTFATSAKDLDKAVEFYTKVIGGQIVKKVEPTEEQLKAGPGEGSGRSPGQLRGSSVRRVDQAARRGPASHAEYPLAGKGKGAVGACKQIGANIEKVRPHRDGVSYSINVFDPDGNRWELSFAKGN
jgi:catechol 2,3-dioxygenase-like lactoylglutathione lyase family enzyme